MSNSIKCADEVNYDSTIIYKIVHWPTSHLVKCGSVQFCTVHHCGNDKIVSIVRNSCLAVKGFHICDVYLLHCQPWKKKIISIWPLNTITCLLDCEFALVIPSAACPPAPWLAPPPPVTL